VKVKCEFCNREVEEQDVKYRLTVGDRTLNYCGLGCLRSAEPLADIRHVSISSIVLNKTFFELFAILTGIGGVYYTLFEIGNRALLMDTVSVITAIAAMIIGVEHLRYVEEHMLIKRAVLMSGILILTLIVLIVWHFGFR
jgi:hypothetical protein